MSAVTERRAARRARDRDGITGTSVRVNLLPKEIDERRTARRVTTFSTLSVVAFVAVLGILYGMKLGEIADAEEAREQVRAEVAQLEAQVAELEQFRRLAEELEARNNLLAFSMEREVSFARVLNDLSLGFPSSASLRSLGATLNDAGSTPPTGVAEAPVLSLTFDGYSVERYAPGVETVLVEFDKVPTFFSSFLSNASIEEIEDTEVTGFTGSVQLTEDARTDRYANGLPEGIPQ